MEEEVAASAVYFVVSLEVAAPDRVKRILLFGLVIP
jgi:hypothetical protein